MTLIDVHAHWFPPAFAEAFGKHGGRPAWPQHPASLAERTDELERVDMDRQILGLGHNQPCFADADGSTTVAKLANDLYAEAIAYPGGRLGAFGAVPLPHVEPALVEATRCLDDLAFAGIGLGTSALGRTLDDPDFEEFWAELDRRHTTVFLHPVGTPDTASTGLGDFLMGPKYGGPQEATIAVTRLVMSGVARRHPGISWIVAPMGGTIAYVWRRFEEISQCLGQDELLADDPFSQLRSFHYDTTLTDDPDIVELFVRKFGAQSLLLGTDAPRVTVDDWVGRVRRCLATVSDVEQGGVLGGTAEKLGLGPRSGS